MGKVYKRIGLLFLFSGIFLSLFSQTGMGFYETQDLQINQGDALKYPTIGGFDNPQFSPIDLDGDGIKDLFVFDRKHNIIRTFIYDIALQEYQYQSPFERYFPDGLIDFVLLRDMNCDGHEDIITFFQGGFRVFQNQGVFPLQFELLISKIRTSYDGFETGAFVLAGDIPAIVDVDNDGDLDILTFGIAGSENTIEWQENLAIDSFGVCDSIFFRANTQCWGNVQEADAFGTLESISCRGFFPPSDTGGRAQRHAGSSVLLLDLDNDGDKDLITGDVGTSRLVRAFNTGDSASANIDVSTQTFGFPSFGDAANIDYQVSGYEIDVDHDNINDLIIAPNNAFDSSFNAGQIWYFKNVDTTGGYQFQSVTKNFLLEEMIDLGSATHPITIDLNGDNLLDLLIGVDFKKNGTANHHGRLYGFMQSQDGFFFQFDDNYANLGNFQFRSVAPTAGDLDGDGDLDMLVGNIDGTLHYFENTSASSVPSFSLTQANYMNIESISAFASPTLADINDDGLLDLLVGEQSGTIAYFENLGGVSSPFYSAEPTIAKLGNIDVSENCCQGMAKPIVVENEEIYGEGKYLFVGSDQGSIEIYRIPLDLSETFNLVDKISLNASEIAPLLADLDSDGIVELLIGTGEGGLKYYDRDGNYPVSASQEKLKANWKLYPNPTHDIVIIEGLQGVHFTITDISGRIVHKGILKGLKTTLSLGNLESGTYLFTPENHKPVSFIKR